MKKFRVLVNGSEYNVEIEELTQVAASPNPIPTPIVSPPRSSEPAPAHSVPATPTPQEAAVGGAIVAPIPGTILTVAVEVGAVVVKGQTLLVLEAMKMENEIQAPADATVLKLNVSQGLSVNTGDTLIVLSQ